MKIIDAIFTPGHAAFYFDDQQAIKEGATQDGFIYQGEPVTQGFSSIRQAGESISILLILDNGMVAKGDCVAVQYSGTGGRDPLFRQKIFLPFLKKHIRNLLIGREVTTFVQNSRFFDQRTINGQRLHTAIRYGISQALLDATAIAHCCSKTEIICREYNLPIVAEPVPLFGQSGDDRYTAVDKMILKQVNALPHALINNIPDKLGYKGEKLTEYVQWLSRRIASTRRSVVYYPDIHIDVYGTVGTIFDHDCKKIADYLDHLQAVAGPFTLYIEGPVDMGNRERQIDTLLSIKNHLSQQGSAVKIVADEWCNTYEDITLFSDAQCCDMVQIKTPDLGCIHNIVESTLYCKQSNMESYQGGTCNETDVSAQTCVHLAMAARPDRMLAKPGMGFDEGMTIVNNEMSRTIALLQRHIEAQPQKVNVDTLAELC